MRFHDTSESLMLPVFDLDPVLRPAGLIGPLAMLLNQTLEVPQLAKNHAQSLLPAPDDLAENRRAIGYQQCEEVWDMARARQG